MYLVGADLLGSQQFRRLVEVPREQGNLLDVHLLGAHCKVPDLHVLDQHAEGRKMPSWTLMLGAEGLDLMVYRLRPSVRLGILVDLLQVVKKP